MHNTSKEKTLITFSVLSPDLLTFAILTLLKAR